MPSVRGEGPRPGAAEGTLEELKMNKSEKIICLLLGAALAWYVWGEFGRAKERAKYAAEHPAADAVVWRAGWSTALIALLGSVKAVRGFGAPALYHQVHRGDNQRGGHRG